MDNEKPAKHVVTASAIIPARTDRVYALIANYNDGHPRILPKEFTNLIVEDGGIGAGTVIRFEMSMFGRKRMFRAAITEPQPGEVLVETILDGEGARTTFVVKPAGAPADSHVTITTELPVRSGIRGRIDKIVFTLMFRPIFVKELANLARIATGPFGS
jgi:hypothetical protein